MSWEYAELSKAASKAGGASKYVDTLIEFGKSTGRKEMLPVVIIALLAGMGANKLYEIYKSRKVKKLVEVENAKQELINAINEYDSLEAKCSKTENDNLDEEALT